MVRARGGDSGLGIYCVYVLQTAVVGGATWLIYCPLSEEIRLFSLVESDTLWCICAKSVIASKRWQLPVPGFEPSYYSAHIHTYVQRSCVIFFKVNYNF